MPIKINGIAFDTVSETTRRLDIARGTLLKYIKEGFFTAPPVKRQGRGKEVRYFPEEWYAENEPKLNPDKKRHC